MIGRHSALHNQSLTVGGESRDSLEVGGSLQHKVAQLTAIQTGREISLKAGAKIVVEAGAEVTLKAGGSFVKVDAGGVHLVGPAINLNSGGSAGSGSAYSGQPAMLANTLIDMKAPAELQASAVSATMQSGQAHVITHFEAAATQSAVQKLSASPQKQSEAKAEEKSAQEKSQKEDAQNEDKASLLQSDLLKPSEELEKLAKKQASAFRKGNNGEEVSLIQQALIKMKFDLQADGDFGNKTKTAIEQFQKNYQPSHQTHLSYNIGPVDGIVGQGTLLALDEALMDGWKTTPLKSVNWADSKFGILLGSVESKNDYSAYNRTQGGLKSFYNTMLNKMTVSEVLAKQEAREIFAAGRFQLIPSTLKDAVLALSIDTTSVFDKPTQDQIFNDYLIRLKRPQIAAFLESTGSVEDAMYAWAKEFASAGVEKGKAISKGRIAVGGESYYSGDGLNKAHLSTEKMKKVLIKSKQDMK